MYDPLKDKTPYGGTCVGQTVRIRFPLESALHAKRCFIILRQAFGEGGEVQAEHLREELLYSRSESGEDIFEGSFSLSEWGIYFYRFEAVLENGDIAFFGRGKNGKAKRQDWLPEWQLTVSKRAYKTPNWAKSGVTYHIFADRFCRVGETPFLKAGRLHTYWTDRPDIAEPMKEYRADDFFGGNIGGIISRLEYLKSLGVTLIYLSPIFKSPSNHRYDTSDYLAIDELFGTEEDFAKLIAAADKLGVKIMLDGVFNHTGADSIYFNKFGHFDSVGACQSKDSPYYDWYTFSQYPSEYACWWGSTVVPTVNKSAEGFRKLILGRDGVIDKWTKMGVRGWRLDVVDELPIDFTTDLCKCVKSVDEDALIIGEVWEDASTKISYDLWRPYFMGEQLDSVMNYPFKRAILDFAMGGSAADFCEQVLPILENYPLESLNVLMNIIGSHDTVRALTQLSGVVPPDSKLARAEFKLDEAQYALARRRLMLASALQFTLPGVPCVYYGDEAGAQGFEDPLNRGTFPWGREDKLLLAHYRALGKLRAKYADLLQGQTYFEDGELLVFSRVSASGRFTVLANSTSHPISYAISGRDAISGKEVKRGVSIPPLSFRFLVQTALFCE